LVKRLVQGNGTCLPIVIRPSARDFPIPLGGTVKIYIPTRKHYTLSLSARQAVAKGETARFTGRLDLHLEFSSNNQQNVPQTGREIELRRTKRDPIEGTVVYETVGTARTDGAGRFTINYAPDQTSDYQAFANKPDRTVDASSNLVTVRVGAGTAPAIKKMPRIPRPLP